MNIITNEVIGKLQLLNIFTVKLKVIEGQGRVYWILNGIVLRYKMSEYKKNRFTNEEVIGNEKTYLGQGHLKVKVKYSGFSRKVLSTGIRCVKIKRIDLVIRK